MSDSIFSIARSGMDVEHQRMEVIAQNIANASTTRTGGGEPYRPLRLVSGPRVDASFTEHLQSGTVTSAHHLKGVQSYGIERLDVAPRLAYDPAHPHADKNGMVAFSGIDHASEMALMVQTQRVYEANTVMFNAARTMYMRALELGNKS